MFYPYPSDISVQEHVHFELDFLDHGSKHYESRSDGSLLEPSDLGSYFLQYSLPKNISGREKQTTKVVTGGKVVNVFQALFLAQQSRRLRVSL